MAVFESASLRPLRYVSIWGEKSPVTIKIPDNGQEIKCLSDFFEGKAADVNGEGMAPMEEAK